MYNVPESIVRHQRAGRTSQRNTHNGRSTLTKLEEEIVIHYVEKLDAQSFAPTLNYVREMANQLLATLCGSWVGKN